ncbi:MAG: hypothetical protein ACERKZ_05785 [Lachnotalea sp.]
MNNKSENQESIVLPTKNSFIVQHKESGILKTKNGYEQFIYRPITNKNGIVSNFTKED